jgi:xanthine dehydrogenase accessory factor
MLAVADDGRLAGAVSAGCFDSWAAEAVLAARRGGYREVVRLGIGDLEAAEAGVACGGVIEVLVEPEVPDELVEATLDCRSTVLVTPLPVGREAAPGPRLVIGRSGARAGGPEGSIGDAKSSIADAKIDALARAALDEGVSRTVTVGERAIFLEVVAPLVLVVVGASEIAVDLVALAHALGMRTVVIDARPAFLTRDRFPDADALLLGWADELADAAGIDESSIVVAVAHDARADDPALVTALRRRARYVGALGSRRTHAARIERLRAQGLDDAELARIHAPIGLDLGGRTAEDIALGILAEIVAELNRTKAG